MAHDKKMAGAARRPGRGTFDTPGGKTYLENLRYILPDAEVDEIVAEVEAEDRRRHRRGEKD